MKICPTFFKEVIVIEVPVFKDNRGFFMETYHQKRYTEAGIDSVFLQDNYSHSVRGVLRGLHYQVSHPQGKLIRALRGEIFDVAVDIRQDSSTFGKWTGLNLSGDNPRQVFIPPGFAHGFCVLSEEADVIYKCTNFYDADDEYGIRWDDPDIAVDWPISNPILSRKDANHPFLKQQPKEHLPVKGIKI